MNKLKKLRLQSGDTIVEVLLAMAVIGMVLGVSYGIANRSVAVGRSAQERSEALKLAETQVELIKEYVSSDTSGDGATEVVFDAVDLSGSPDSACFVVDSVTGVISVAKIDDTLITPVNECRFNTLYQVSVACISGVPNNNATPVALGASCGSGSAAALRARKIVVRVTWERVGGGLQTSGEPIRDSLDIFYRYGG